MYKKILAILILLVIITNAKAAHLKGGWIQYQYLSTDSSAQKHKYRITVRQYMLCTSSGGQIDGAVNLGIFYRQDNTLRQTINIPITNTILPNKTTFDTCISPKPKIGDVCYRIDEYTTEVELPFSVFGYILAVQRCCRISGIVNMENSGSNGITYATSIPGTIGINNYSINNSPVFGTKDTVMICYNTPFSMEFGATDADGDSLTYNFCSGFTGGDQSTPIPVEPSRPPYRNIPYQSPYSAEFPLGNNVSINTKTGLISGFGPPTTGDYVIAVCVNEFRNGVLFASTKKEIHVNVANCQIGAAVLKPSYINCNNRTFQFENESGSSSIIKYLWEFGDGDTSHKATPPPHTYKDTGTYILKLSVVSAGCKDTAIAIVKTYPGFNPNFTYTGYCLQNNFTFKNTTYAQYGFVDSVFYDFGVTTLTTDTSSKFNTFYKYNSVGSFNVRLYARSTKGCEKDTFKVIQTHDKPFVSLNFKDTLICSIDTLPLIATVAPTASVKWGPGVNITSTTSPSTLVFPKDTITYYITVNENGCITKDSLRVNVLDFITVDAGPDTSICLTDSYKMRTVSHALGYKWIPGGNLDDSTKKFPIATPPYKFTKYHVYANLGKCQDNDSVSITTFAYPYAKILTDTTICFGDSVKLIGIISNAISPTADTFFWSPTATLKNRKSLTPIAKPNYTQDYVLTSRYLTGCLKPKKDTVTVSVVQPFFVFAGRDTNVVFNQPVQLRAFVLDSSDKKFTWINSFNNSIVSTNQNPVFNFPSTLDSVVYAVKAYTAQNCKAYDTIKVRIFKTMPSIFMPTAFTPNKDFKNDIYRPTFAGIGKLNYFTIFNRWGQQLYTTSSVGAGWDGNFAGTKQNPGTYVYIVKGEDYLGNIIEQKGTFVLIR